VNRIHSLIEQDPGRATRIRQFASDTRPIACARLEQFANKFIQIKKLHGSDREKAIYDQIAVRGLFERLLKKRPRAFFSSRDTYLLRNQIGFTSTGNEGFEDIGTNTDNGANALTLADYMSYDEMLLSACIGVSVPTYFINKGERENNGVPAAQRHFREEGVFVGLVGARFERENLMEWKLCMVTQEQNTLEKGFGVQEQKANMSQQGMLIHAWAELLQQGEPDKKLYYLPAFADAQMATKVLPQDATNDTKLV